MITVESIMAILGFALENESALIAFGVDVGDIFTKAEALVTSDTASTAEARATALAAIKGMQAQRDAGLVVLQQTAPGS